MNITLLGMSGVGKSYIGKRLAEKLGYECIDIDQKIETKFNKSLHKILDEIGDEAFLKEEQEQVMGLGNLENTVISPGGSVIYSKTATDVLRHLSKSVYLSAPSAWIQERSTPDKRGIVGFKERSFEELHAERAPLYGQVADLIITMPGKEADEVIGEITTWLESTF
jgi:shikimate kinase